MTSLNDTTLTKVTYGKYAIRVPDEVAYGIYGWFSSQLNTLLPIIKVNIVFRNLAILLINSFEKLPETPGVLMI